MTDKKKVEIDWKIVIAGMLLLTVVVIAALSTGHNGVILKSYMVLIGLVIGAFALPLDKFVKN